MLLLDNCEHVIDSAAELAQAIAKGSPSVRVLATSREGLGLGDEQLIAVAPLDPPGRESSCSMLGRSHGRSIPTPAEPQGSSVTRVQAAAGNGPQRGSQRSLGSHRRRVVLRSR